MSFQSHVEQITNKMIDMEALWKISEYGPNPEQKKAITEHLDGPLLMIAGPGSGKTFTLVDRVVYLVTEKGQKPENLLVVTFTEKAARELMTRIANRLIALGVRFNLNEMYLGTFHSICLRWLEEFREFTRLKRNFTMMDQFDQQYFLYQRLNEYLEIEGIEHIIGSPKANYWYKSKNLLRWINLVSEEALDAEVLKAADHPEVRALGACYDLYQAHLEEANALDFSTIQYEALKLLREHPNIRDELHQRISYMMVDEYQDTNSIQEQILFELAGENPNMCVVGDDDQGLYRFRGATIRNILQFKENFEPGACEQVELTTNYRSHPDIINFYNRWIKDQSWESDGKHFRYQKEVVPPENQEFPAAPTVVKVASDKEDVFHHEMLNFLYSMRDRGHLTDWNQVAFLFRSVKNERVRRLAQFLERNHIPVYAPRANQFFERDEIRLMIGALIFLFPQFAEVRKWNANAHLNIWDYYDNECFRLFAQELKKPENDDLLRWGRSLARKHMALTENTDYGFSGLFYQLLRFPLFSQYLDEDRLKDGLQSSRAMHNLAILSQMLSKFEYLHNISVFTPKCLDKNLRDLFNQFLRYLMDGGIDEYEDEAEYAPSGSVSFLTIHQSKGLEFPVVVVGSLWTTPRKNYKPLDEILESNGYLSRPPFEPLSQIKYYDFRRLFYTAFSRAQNLLVLAAHLRDGRWRVPSKSFKPYFDGIPSWRSPQFNPEKIPLATIREIEFKREYSFTSHLLLYENCAEQYRFFKELEFAPVRTNPILFGTLVHQTIEDIHKTVLRGEEHRLSERQVESWFDTNYVYLTKRERVYLTPLVKRLALEHVTRYYHHYAGDWSHVREAEVDISLVKDDYILKGTVDLIAGEHNTVELVDFKTEKKPDINNPDDRIKLDRYRRQLEVYAHIVEERTGLQVSKTHLYYTSEEAGNPYISFEKDTRSIESTIATFDRVVRRIEEQDFRIPERPVKLCGDCDMRNYCDMKNWKFTKRE